MEPTSRKSSQEPTSGSELPTVPERWSAPRKTEVVFRLLWGDPLDRVSRQSQVPAHELEYWQRTFIKGGMQGLKGQTEPEDWELLWLRAKLGEVMMRLELAEGLIEKKAFGWSGRCASHEAAAESSHPASLSAHDDLPDVSTGTVDGLCGHVRPRRAGAAETRPEDRVD